MPHPDRASDVRLGSADGAKIFLSMAGDHSGRTRASCGVSLFLTGTGTGVDKTFVTTSLFAVIAARRIPRCGTEKQCAVATGMMQVGGQLRAQRELRGVFKNVTQLSIFRHLGRDRNQPFPRQKRWHSRIAGKALLQLNPLCYCKRLSTWASRC